MDKNVIEINYKAPYYKVGSVTDQTINIWMVFHGYGQLAKPFSQYFSILSQPDNCLIFPQGLSKFYLKGVDKAIGANWMTSHNRKLDIENYISYLNKIYEMEIGPYRANIHLNILGFSQGVHTASRWIYSSEIKYNKFILWGANLPHEVTKETVNKVFFGDNFFVVGDKDRFINAEQLQRLRNRYKDIGFSYELVLYNGQHDIYPDILKKLV